MNNFGLSIISTFVRGVKSLRIENKKRTSEACKNSLAPQNLKDGVLISILSTSLGFVESFFQRGDNGDKPRAYPTS